MDHATLVKDAAARSGLPEPEVERVIAALADLVHHAHASTPQPGDGPREGGPPALI